MAWGAWLHRSEHLLETSGMIHGASYADVYGRMPAALLQVVAALVGAALAVLHAFGKRNWPIPAAIALYAVVARSAARATAAWCSASPSHPTSRCARRRSSNTTSPRRGGRSALDAVDERELSGDARADAARHRPQCAPRSTTSGSGITSRCSRRSAQIQEIRTYYDFASVDNDRYHIDGAAASGDAVGARAQLGEPAEPHLGQRATDVHTRLRPDAGPGQRGHERRTAGAVRARPPTASTIPI